MMIVWTPECHSKLHWRTIWIWRFPRIWVPPVITHFRSGFSMKETIQQRIGGTSVWGKHYIMGYQWLGWKLWLLRLFIDETWLFTVKSEKCLANFFYWILWLKIMEYQFGYSDIPISLSHDKVMLYPRIIPYNIP